MRVTRGFTLMEALITVAILAMIGTLTFGTFARAMEARDRATEITDRYHGVRQAMLRMAREISVAFLSVHKDCADPRTATLFQGKRASFGTRLDFTSFSHYKMRADANESDQNELSYFVELDPDHAGRKNLVRREQNRIDEKPDQGGVTQVMAENVESLTFEFYDPRGDRWEDDWDSTGRDFKNRLPKFVSIKLMVKEANGKELTFTTKTRVFLREAISIPGAGFTPCIE
ncbi:MAG TPA: type II secretion system protein GspJ [Myxococcota bacterium]|nr:type II secretion system protein GspJ [Myxococcota bacterium]